jgi:hypothetical protein
MNSNEKMLKHSIKPYKVRKNDQNLKTKLIKLKKWMGSNILIECENFSPQHN